MVGCSTSRIGLAIDVTRACRFLFPSRSHGRCGSRHLMAVLLGTNTLMLSGGAMACTFEKFADSPHLKIKDTAWIVDEWGQSCDFGISGGMEIRAINELTHDTVVIVMLPDIVSPTKLVSESSDVLT